jgi:hypothetical protein
VVVDVDIDIDAPRDVVWKLHTGVGAWPTWQTDITDSELERPLAPGVFFRWTTAGMTITSTVYSLTEGSRILWGGTVNGITGIHEWAFSDIPDGVHVATSESFSGAPVEADAENMQHLLEESLTSWLQKMKETAESR